MCPVLLLFLGRNWFRLNYCKISKLPQLFLYSERCCRLTHKKSFLIGTWSMLVNGQSSDVVMQSRFYFSTEIATEMWLRTDGAKEGFSRSPFSFDANPLKRNVKDRRNTRKRERGCGRYLDRLIERVAKRSHITCASMRKHRDSICIQLFFPQWKGIKCILNSISREN